MAAAETHLGIDDDVIARTRQILVIHRPHRYLVTHDNRLEITLPHGIPVLLLDEFDGMGHGEISPVEAAEHRFQIRLRELFLRDEGIEQRFLHGKTVEAQIRNLGLHDFGPFLAERRNRYVNSNIVHIQARMAA